MRNSKRNRHEQPSETMAEPLLKQRLLTADEYHAMARAGILDEDERVELLDGRIVPMSPVGGPHITCVNRIDALFQRRILLNELVGVEASVQNPVRLDPHWEPEPDVALLREAEVAGQVPTADRVLLLVEVADTSVERDRGVKLPRYAAAGIPEVWIVNLPEQHIEVYRQPGDDGYAEQHVCRAGEAIRSVSLGPLGEVPVDDMLVPF